MFKIDAGYNFVGPQFQYYISGKAVRKDTGEDLDPDNTVHFLQNRDKET